MTKENIIPVVNQQKLVEEVRELEENSGSDFVSERGKGGYGPMPFVDEATALIVARTDDIMNRLEGKYPNIVKIFKHNPKGTVE
ncbi:6824_t:CDS:2 [Funneliformis geosporum]|uniref:6824_t:CDS:1 n=1 Tax=Funneliformis geosporum TaxID=1117311 RepID=A0A9W4SBA8_9GLOM|nr:6824_t:CDS:2 [Funneliformis geosporum]